MTKKAFKPIIDSSARILILGSMPGEQSLTEQQYYANKRNAFWQIMFDVFNAGKHLTDYQDKTNLLRRNDIGLWDVFASCEREGSLDVNIRNGMVNDFETLFKTHPQIRLILFNGSTSYKSFKKQMALTSDMLYGVMPSTSPANTVAYQIKLTAWSAALKQF
ncbi:DNA-deoxyinosine glycosylase [Mucilaginibacter paludis]|uniref:Uracil-DNA glycosylase-like domain-containing protein n=1 Tax=Mucilaginibacter paludis DSM 18603 TaxID=714943 RepID=H1YHB4_9SPHI|nr:DNA-deoxyinosine glycosylase [Mucilaginibacter paludis]EHQ25448.1 hypothetical protein Mucpa_1284 [Mucilaginibacter paludis DSM 18603]